MVRVILPGAGPRRRRDPPGTGKTHLALALGHLAIRQGAEVHYAPTSRVLADLAGGHADHTWEARLRKLARPALLILDLS